MQNKKLESIAKEILVKHGDDYAKAAAKLNEEIESNPKLVLEVGEPIRLELCLKYLRWLKHKDVSVKKNGSTLVKSHKRELPSNPRRPEHHAAAMKILESHSILDNYRIYLSNGHRIAIGYIPVAHLEMYETQSRKLSREYWKQAEVLSEIRRRISRHAHVPEDALVRDVFGEEALEVLHDLIDSSMNELFEMEQETVNA